MPHRVLRVTMSEIGRVLRGATPTHAHLRGRLVAVGLVTVLVDVVAAAIAFAVERRGTGTEIHTYGDALFWTSTQLLTVSSQLRNPVTTAGRVLDVFMEAYAITVVGALAGSFGAFFHRRGTELRAEEAS